MVTVVLLCIIGVKCKGIGCQGDIENPYCVRLKAQLDSDILGNRLKGEFKTTSADIAGERKIISLHIHRTLLM